MKLTPEFLKDGADNLDALLSRLEEKPNPSVPETMLGVAAGEAFHDAKMELLLFVIARAVVRNLTSDRRDPVADQLGAVLDAMEEKGLV